ncbi:PLD nuclease N-terminal domain-containing protein [Frondihabitans australicus]|nr:PLD nuclease N-terminal domain-containing protein [Frondihabitans australicus]
MPYLFEAVTVILIIVALVDLIPRQDHEIQHMPKVVWALLIILIPVVGVVLWFVIGRQYRAPQQYRTTRDPHETSAPMPHPASNRVKTTEEELADLDREIEFYEKQAKLKRLQSEVDGAPDEQTT